MPSADLLDDDSRELAVRLLTRAGMIMEDASAVAVLCAGDGVSLPEVVGQLEKASAALAALVSAARALVSE